MLQYQVMFSSEVLQSTAVTHVLNYEVVTDRHGKSRYKGTVPEIVRRSLVGPEQTDRPSDFSGTWKEAGKYLLQHSTTEIFSADGLTKLGFKGENPVSLEEAFDALIAKSREELAAARATGKTQQIVAVQKRIAREVRNIISSAKYEEGVDFPAGIVQERALNCVGAEYLGGYVLDQIGLTFLIGETPGHSIHLLVTLEDGEVYFADMLATETEVKMDDQAMEGATKKDILQLAINPSNSDVVTFEIVTDKLDELKNQTLNRQGQQFTCRVYSFEIGYALQVLYNLSIKFNKPEWVMGFAQMGLELSPKYAPLVTRLGTAQEILHESEAALKNLTEALRLEPKVAEHYFRLARYHSDRQHYSEAMDLLDQAEAISPNYALIPLKKGSIYERTNQPEPAMAEYERATQIDPRAADPKIALMRIYLARGDEARAALIAQEALAVNLYERNSLIQIARLVEKFSQDLAEQFYKKACMSSAPSSCRFAYAEFLHRVGKQTESMAVLAQIEEKCSQEVSAIQELAEKYLEVGNEAKARELLARALSLPYKDHQQIIQDYLLQFYVGMDEFPEMYTTATFWLLDDDIYLDIAEIFQKVSDYDNALKALDIAIDINPFSIQSYLEKAQLLAKQSRQPEAEAVLEKMLATDFDRDSLDWWPFDEAIELAHKMGNVDLVNQLFTKMLEYPKEQADWIAHFARFAKDYGIDPDLAGEAQEKILALGRMSAEEMALYAESLYDQNHQPEAEAVLGKIVTNSFKKLGLWPFNRAIKLAHKMGNVDLVNQLFRTMLGYPRGQADWIAHFARFAKDYGIDPDLVERARAVQIPLT